MAFRSRPRSRERSTRRFRVVPIAFTSRYKTTLPSIFAAKASCVYVGSTLKINVGAVTPFPTRYTPGGRGGLGSTRGAGWLTAGAPRARAGYGISVLSAGGSNAKRSGGNPGSRSILLYLVVAVDRKTSGEEGFRTALVSTVSRRINERLRSTHMVRVPGPEVSVPPRRLIVDVNFAYSARTTSHTVGNPSNSTVSLPVTKADWSPSKRRVQPLKVDAHAAVVPEALAGSLSRDNVLRPPALHISSRVRDLLQEGPGVLALLGERHRGEQKEHEGPHAPQHITARTPVKRVHRMMRLVH